MTTDFDFAPVREQLDAQGFALTPPLLTSDECAELAGRFDDGRIPAPWTWPATASAPAATSTSTTRCRSSIGGLRAALYPALAAVANDWAARLGEPAGIPGGPRSRSSTAATPRPAPPDPLILRYGTGGHDTLHQDVYGEVVFPLQALTMLNRPGEDFTGGELVLVEQRPRAQSRAHVVPAESGRVPALPDAPPPGRRDPRRLSRGDAPRRVDRALRRAHDAGNHLPRRHLSGAGHLAAQGLRPPARPGLILV